MVDEQQGSDDRSPTACPRCGRQQAICVCDRTLRLASRLRVLVLQHPQEQDVELGSARLLAQSLTQCKLAVGLSWRSLAHAWQDEVKAPRWAVIFPDPEIAATDERARLTSRHGEPLAAASIEGLVVLDGTWSQAKTLWWRNPWLLKLARLTLFPKEPSIYGRLRKEPRPQYVSTLEAVADALSFCGEDEMVRTQLRRLFRTLVQRARDAR